MYLHSQGEEFVGIRAFFLRCQEGPMRDGKASSVGVASQEGLLYKEMAAEPWRVWTGKRQESYWG